MIRKVLFPLAAATLLAGCVSTAPYGHRDGIGDRGDYYYGRPSVEYRYHGMYGYPRHGYPYYGPYSSRYFRYYGHPYSYYGYGYPGYYNPYYGYPYYPPVYRPRPGGGGGGDTGGTGGTVDTRPDGGPWRNLDDLRRRRSNDTGVTGMAPITRPSFPQPSSQPRARSSSGSAMGEMMRRRAESRNEVEE